MPPQQPDETVIVANQVIPTNYTPKDSLTIQATARRPVSVFDNDNDDGDEDEDDLSTPVFAARGQPRGKINHPLAGGGKPTVVKPIKK